MIDLQVIEDRLVRSVERAKERNIVIPTFGQMKDPGSIPEPILQELKDIGLWDVNPRNLVLVTWKNEPKDEGEACSGVIYLEFTSNLR